MWIPDNISLPLMVVVKCFEAFKHTSFELTCFLDTKFRQIYIITLCVLMLYSSVDRSNDSRAHFFSSSDEHFGFRADIREHITHVRVFI